MQQGMDADDYFGSVWKCMITLLGLTTYDDAISLQRAVHVPPIQGRLATDTVWDRLVLRRWVSITQQHGSFSRYSW